MPNANEAQLQQLTDATAQAHVKEDPIDGGTNVDVFSWMASANSLIPLWWSRTRDKKLRDFMAQNDYLLSAAATLNSKIATIPFHVEARDPSVVSHVRMADEYTRNLYDMSDFGAGWGSCVSKWTSDLFGQDNGGFMEVIGDGPKDGPIVGPALGLAALDSARCNRTNNPIYPVFYHDTDGKRYKLHYTRVIAVSQNPSPRADMNGVGYCALSRCLMAAQNLYDIAVYKMEKLGSRPKRQLLIARKGLTSNDVVMALRAADSQMDNETLSRFSKHVVIGPKRATANTEIQLDQIDLASTPDGFNEMDSITLGVYLLAWAYGVDAREFWPATSSGATKADAMVQHMKARGKAVGNTIGILDQQIDRFFLPPFLRMVHDVQDDDEDEQRANISNTRSQARAADLTSGVIDIRTARQKMVSDGELTQEQFDALELEDGRLPSGEGVLSLFYSADMDEFLELGVDDPLRVAWDEVREIVTEKRAEAMRVVVLQMNSATSTKKAAARLALAALDALENELSKKKTQAAPVAPAGPTPPANPVPPQQLTAGGEEAATKALPDDLLREYRDRLAGVVNGGLAGDMTAADIAAAIENLLTYYADRIYSEIAAEYGYAPNQNEIRRWLDEQHEFIGGFAASVADASRDPALVDAIDRRTTAWGTTMDDWANYAGMVFQQERMATWRIGAHHPTKEHCGSCRALNGQRHPVSWFMSRGYVPRQKASRTLECGGWECGCGLVDDGGRLIDKYGSANG